MSIIYSVGTAVPPYIISQDVAMEFANNLFKEEFKDIERLLMVFNNTQIKKRHFCVSSDWFKYEHSFEEKNIIYIKNAIELAKEAIKNCLLNTQFKTEDIDHIFFISSTGISTPSIDAFLFNDIEIAFNPHIKRTPIWGLGCAGGAVGLARAMEYTKAHSSEKVVVVALEIGELAFIKSDLSKSNLIATSLFGDGAAAVLIVGEEVIRPNEDNRSLTIVDSLSTIWPNTLDVMGWDVKNDGLKVIFSKNIPSIINNDLRPNIDFFLNKNQLTLSDIQFYVLHPGGTKVIDAYKESLQIPEDRLIPARNILSEYGNMSSPTVLFVLKEIMQNCPRENRHGILLALGPGFSSEMLLLEWK